MAKMFNNGLAELSPAMPPLSHYQDAPESLDAVVSRLDDGCLVPDAEAYRFLDKKLHSEMLSEAGREIVDLMSYAGYTAAEAFSWYQLKYYEAGNHTFGVRVDKMGNHHEFSAENPQARISG